ncbi:DDE superfamily endonuclease [Nitzschia inconspicua]|uniref:DDE superfamily endonuclease n=1 Tax=Nitzschia inconspicua TaxID=303405 RepID=A0A9K3Q573_9STRA|nr:DDE superfamily endonuclease [Nitzschia inconspicua]
MKDDPFPDFSHVPAYDSFFNHHDLYFRYHIHLIGAEAQDRGAAFDKRRNRFGRPRVVDAVADPYVIVETVGKDTGSTSYFPIGKHKFSVLENSQSPLWDEKTMIMGKNVDGIKFQLLDKNTKTADELLMEFTLDKADLPEPTPLKDSSWTQFHKKGIGGRQSNMVLSFRIMVTRAGDQMVDKDTSRAFHQSYDGGYAYSEEVLPDATTGDDTDNALLQCWRHQSNKYPKKAILWILGRNDVFMHPHVAARLFQGHDLYVLNYKLNGHTRKRGWVQDAHLVSHNRKGDFNVYKQDIAAALEVLQGIEYDQVLGYAQGAAAILYLDAFTAHFSASTKAKLETQGVQLRAIPPGCTGLVQPIDVGVGKPFKDRVRQKWIEWMMRQDAEAPVMTNASRADCAAWVAESWRNLPQSILKNSWRKSGFSWFPADVDDSEDADAEIADVDFADAEDAEVADVPDVADAAE